MVYSDDFSSCWGQRAKTKKSWEFLHDSLSANDNSRVSDLKWSQKYCGLEAFNGFVNVCVIVVTKSKKRLSTGLHGRPLFLGTWL